MIAIQAEMLIAFIGATIVLGLIPGPNVALNVANSVTYGPRYGFLTVAGTSAAMIPQLALTCIGMATALRFLADVFEILRWVGVAYLVYIGWRQWTAPVVDLAAIHAQPKSVKAIFWRGFLVSLTNPKTLLFYSAFFPQFVDAQEPVLPQLVVLSAIFLGVMTMIDCAWSLLAGSARHFLTARGRLRNRIGGGFLIAAAAGLALARK
ncbi:MAG: LysE family translocator [Micavibrio aeruginosavorus]|nr:LysE family translocator [Micavibrio aeruginosavorus]